MRDIAKILRPGLEVMAEYAEWARVHPDDPEVVRRKAEEAAREEAYRKRIAYLDWCVATKTSPIRGGEQ